MVKFNVIIYNFNAKVFEPYDIIPSLVEEYRQKINPPSDFNGIKKFILDYSRSRWWSRCEYEMLISDWPTNKIQEKWDIYDQIEMNIDIITAILMTEINYGSERNSNT